MRIISNPLLGRGLKPSADLAAGEVSTDITAAAALYDLCPRAHATEMLELPDLAMQMGIAGIHLKDERNRLGLGSFKALGAAFAIAKLAASKIDDGTATAYEKALSGITFVCASAGNHGLSMAAGARLFGAEAVVYLAQTVPEGFAGRLRDKGAKVVREGENYEASMRAAMAAAENNNWRLLSDSSWTGYSELARDVMQGYLIMGAEAASQIQTPPSHIFLQAGVGGLAAACTAAARENWGPGPKIIVVEPDRAPALIESIMAGGPVGTDGPASNMGRLDCKEPSHLALKYLALQADAFMTISDDAAVEAVQMLADHNIITTPSGAAGFAGLMSVIGEPNDLGIEQTSRVLVYISEGPEDG